MWWFWREPTHPCVPLGILRLQRAPPDHSYRDLGILHSRCDQLSLALAESCWGGRSPVIASPRVSPPPDALCHPRPDSSSLEIVIVQETPPTILLLKSLFKQRYHEPFVPGALCSDNRRLRSRESPYPYKWESPSRHCEWFRLLGPCLAPRLGPSPQDCHRQSDASSDLAPAVALQEALSRTIRSWRRSCDYRRLRSKGIPFSFTGGSRLQGVPPLHSEWTSRASPSPQRWIRFMGVPFSNANGIRLMEVPTLSRWSSSPSGWDSPQGVPPPSLQRMGFASRGSPSPSPSEWNSPQGAPPLHSEWDSLQGSLLQSEWDSPPGGPPLSRGFPSPSEWDSPQGASPLHSEWDSLQGSPLFQREWDSPQGVPLSNANGICFKGVPFSKANNFRFQDSPSPQRQCFASTNPASSRHQHSSCASSENNPFERPHLRSSPTIHLPFQRR